jgi:hypothetical protein
MFLARPFFPTNVCSQLGGSAQFCVTQLSPTTLMLFPLLFVGGAVPSGFFGAGCTAAETWTATLAALAQS